ncbi:hypothetical protein CAPTEDRAFT_185085 [Capitella teleta]|uniref:Uncharacterized protein n=1 Tax=Capitella teleta TaxID=283909 RepID=R7TX97_CAPTE|nr:hypothetical protein CAPTEDRAFT_185085 [Capitella teleta]|eukprot:ELT98227.1 hypothetical protein CAPTEDRAFT_185085 [Capitella teleta]
MHFDDALHEVGDTGAYQVGVYFMIATMEFLAADAIQMNFMGYDMPHWCRVPRLDNFTYTQQKYIAIPDDEQCETFDLPWDSFTDDELLDWDRTNRTANVTDFVSCSNGWVYDQSEFVSTVNSEVVSKSKAVVLCCFEYCGELHYIQLKINQNARDNAKFTKYTP